MNRKTLAILIVAATAAILLWQTNLLNDLLLFVLVGAIPGTTHSLPPLAMLILVSTLAWVAIFHFATMRALRTRLLESIRNTLTTPAKQRDRANQS